MGAAGTKDTEATAEAKVASSVTSVAPEAAAAAPVAAAAETAGEGATGVAAVAAPEVVLPALAVAGAGYLAITQIPGLKNGIVSAAKAIEDAMGPLKPDADALAKSMSGVFVALEHAFDGMKPTIHETGLALGELEKSAAPVAGGAHQGVR